MRLAELKANESWLSAKKTANIAELPKAKIWYRSIHYNPMRRKEATTTFWILNSAKSRMRRMHRQTTMHWSQARVAAWQAIVLARWKIKSQTIRRKKPAKCCRVKKIKKLGTLFKQAKIKSIKKAWHSIRVASILLPSQSKMLAPHKPYLPLI